MNKFKFYFIGLMATATLFSCQQEDTTSTPVPLKDYETQYDAELKIIDAYLNTHYIEFENKPGEQIDQNVTISKITDATTQVPIKSYENNSGDTYPQLKSRLVNQHGFNYKLYYLVIRPGSKNPSTNRGGESPCNTDSVLAAYSGSYLKETSTTEGTSVSATFFEDSKYPERFTSLMGVIKGWSEVFPQFKTGWFSGDDNNGKISYFDFGAGVMFIPSGLAYYNLGAGSIPSYSPLVFSFKLYEIERVDTDGDGIFNYLEDLDTDNYMYSFVNTTNYPKYPDDSTIDWYKDDTDRDGMPNFLDIDDDGDNYSTKFEIAAGSDPLDKLSTPKNL